jgi:hypothetical protein
MLLFASSPSLFTRIVATPYRQWGAFSWRVASAIARVHKWRVSTRRKRFIFMNYSNRFGALLKANLIYTEKE